MYILLDIRPLAVRHFPSDLGSGRPLGAFFIVG